MSNFANGFILQSYATILLMNQEKTNSMIAFGPVPSRRLGKSLGINNIPPKACTYSCVYCQLGRTIALQTKRRAFYAPKAILKAVEKKIENALHCKETIDCLTFVPDGEPTLDIHLEEEIESLQPLGIKVAVITNGSLIWHEDVRATLMKADWVSLKIDSLSEKVWRKINRPHGILKLSEILKGMIAFARKYTGELVTETMLLDGFNDGEQAIGDVADFLTRLNPARAYLSIPHRPPAEKRVHPPGETNVNRAYHLFSQKLDAVEYLIGYEGNAFAFTGDVEADLLSITSVHPMRKEAVGELLRKGKMDWDVVHRLIRHKRIAQMNYKGQTYYMRRLR